jgi:hypothetical protein
MESIQWKDTYRGVIDGQEVRASITNQAADDLFNNLLYLKTIIDQIEAGKALVIYDQVVDTSVSAGMSVYRDTDNIWRAAISELEAADNSTLFELTEASQVTGIVLAKSSATRGDVVLFGEIVTTADILNFIDGTYVSGALYYLSPSTAGSITASRGVAPIKVGTVTGPDANGAYRLLFSPEQRVNIDSHSHVRFTLEDAPAGEANCVPGKDAEIIWGDFEPDGPYPGVIHTVDNADDSLVGWLPADDPAFDGLAVPSGAKFGYNIQADEELLAYWPPLPIDGVDVTVDGVSATDDKVIVNSDGIWWMDDTYGNAPWPVNLPCGSSSSTSYEVWPIRIELWFTRMLSATSSDSINNQALIATGVHEGLVPSATGDNISTIITDEGVPVLQLQIGGTGSSLGPGELDPNTVVYRMVGRDYLDVGRDVAMPIEIVLGASATLLTISDIIDGLTLSITRVPAASGNTVKDVADISTTILNWTDTPSTLTVVPDSQYYRMRTAPIAINPGETLIVTLAWSPSVLVDTSDKVYVYAVRPVYDWS